MKEKLWTATAIKSLRKLTKENTARFGESLGKSPRTIEDWEQGRHKPDGASEILLAARAENILNERKRPEYWRHRDCPHCGAHWARCQQDVGGRTVCSITGAVMAGSA